MMSRTTQIGFPIVTDQVQGLQMFPMTSEELVSPSDQASSSSVSHSSSILFNLSLLKDKLSQAQTLVGVLVSPDQTLPESTSMAIASSINSVIQEIIVSATSVAFTSQQIALCSSSGTTMSNCTKEDQLHQQQQSGGEHKLPQLNFANNSNSIEVLDWFGENNSSNFNLKNDDDRISGLAISEKANNIRVPLPLDQDETDGRYKKVTLSEENYDIVELDATELLAKYTHYCQICGKGFKRDANLRMHMRAHGDEFKTSAALSNPNKGIVFSSESKDCLMNSRPKKYSCPHEGCRWNRKHARFQPLKSMICVKNHYKRSHCPKMYVCKRCNQKQFSVLSDLRTHEKHCGDVKWQCSCGSTFSRKDKLMGHVALFIGHAPAINYLSCPEKLQHPALQSSYKS